MANQPKIFPFLRMPPRRTTQTRTKFITSQTIYTLFWWGGWGWGDGKVRVGALRAESESFASAGIGHTQERGRPRSKAGNETSSF